jgi:hypothetical protein
MATPSDVAKQMFRIILSEGELHQSRAVGIASGLGGDFVYKNRHGNRAIRRDVLDEFIKLRKQLRQQSKFVVLWCDGGPYNKRWILFETDSNGRLLGRPQIDTG